MKKWIALTLALVMLLALCACGGGGGVANTKWTLTSVEADGMTIDGDMLAMIGMECTLTFTSSEFSMDMMGVAVEGTFTEDGSKVSMTAEGETLVANVSGGKLIM